ncbi:MAG: hypothetical protein HN341_05155 [Verrucomicrobia bacterium]|nr:hypothetical protein [Verrucomicrobiota bacterium]
MSERLRALGTLFVTGYIQVVLITVNTWQIANGKYLSALPVAFAISFLWTLNVKQIAFGSIPERLIYSGGAMTGCVSGILLSGLVYV